MPRGKSGGTGAKGKGGKGKGGKGKGGKGVKGDGIENPAEHFLDATIRVRGVIEKRDGRPQIVVEEPGQIVVVTPAEEADSREP